VRLVRRVEQWFCRMLHERGIGGSPPPLEAFLEMRVPATLGVVRRNPNTLLTARPVR
jgi:hypothetical protein